MHGKQGARLLLQLPAQVAVDAAEVVEGAHQLALLRLQLLALQPHVVGRAAPGGRPQLEAQLADGRVRLLERAEQVLAARPMRQLHRRVHAFLGLTRPFDPATLRHARNRNNRPDRARPSPELAAQLDLFFAPHNAALYAWAEDHGVPFPRWENASAGRATS